MKKIIFILLPVIALTISCKKKTDSVPTPNATTNSPTTFNAFCSAINKHQFTIGNNNTTFIKNYSVAFFTPNTLTTTATGSIPLYGCGTVVVSDFDTLKYNSGVYEYTTGITQYFPPIKWKGTGTTSFPAFTATCTEIFPSLSINSFSVFPNSISKSVGFNINLVGLNNTDRVALTLKDNIGHSIYSGEKNPSNGIVNFTFDSQQISTISNTNLGEIDFILLNDEIQTVNIKNIRFSNVTQFSISGFNITN